MHRLKHLLPVILIQIHLMFLFIFALFVVVALFVDSNTSYVLVYLYRKSMESVSNILFKYILCSCLSPASFSRLNATSIQIHLMFLFIPLRSHWYWGLQGIQIHLMFLFIWQRGVSEKGRDFNSNTSYVLVYRRIQFPENSLLLLFKYILCSCLSAPSIVVSSPLPLIQIHLMFLFISISRCLQNGTTEFKYILCSCLSSVRLWLCCGNLIQIHLMFLFIIKTILTMGGHSRIQIHLMFLFIVFF